MDSMPKQLKPEETSELAQRESGYGPAAEAIRRAAAFPTRGGKFVQIERKSWYTSMRPKRATKER